MVAVKWEIGSRHPLPDICDFYTRVDLFGLGKGVYPKDKVPPFPAHPHCLCRLTKLYKGEVDLSKQSKDIRGNGNQYLQGLSKQQMQKILGVRNNQQYEQGGDWQKLLPNWKGLGKQGSRLGELKPQLHGHKSTDEELMAKNLLPPTDEFIASIAKKYNMKYTLGKKGKERFYADDGNPIYPLNDGFVGEPEKVTLKAESMLVDRYGSGKGYYLSSKEVTFKERALPRTTKREEYTIFDVKKDIQDVLSGVAAAWFGEPGGGVQYKLSTRIDILVREGYLEEVES